MTGLATNTTRTTESNASGLYRFDAVDPGPYKLTVKLTGFRTFVATQFTVGAAQSITQDATLEVGDVQQVVEVSEAGLQLQTEAPVRGGNVDLKTILELPYANRNPVNLGLTLPGVTTSKFATPTNTFVVNGASARGTGLWALAVVGSMRPITHPCPETRPDENSCQVVFLFGFEVL